MDCERISTNITAAAKATARFVICSLSAFLLVSATGLATTSTAARYIALPKKLKLCETLKETGKQVCATLTWDSQPGERGPGGYDAVWEDGRAGLVTAAFYPGCREIGLDYEQQSINPAAESVAPVYMKDSRAGYKGSWDGKRSTGTGQFPTDAINLTQHKFTFIATAVSSEPAAGQNRPAPTNPPFCDLAPAATVPSTRTTATKPAARSTPTDGTGDAPVLTTNAIAVAKKRIADAVKAHTMTQAQANQMLAMLQLAQATMTQQETTSSSAASPTQSNNSDAAPSGQFVDPFLPWPSGAAGPNFGYYYADVPNKIVVTENEGRDRIDYYGFDANGSYFVENGSVKSSYRWDGKNVTSIDAVPNASSLNTMGSTRADQVWIQSAMAGHSPNCHVTKNSDGTTTLTYTTDPSMPEALQTYKVTRPKKLSADVQASVTLAASEMAKDMKQLGQQIPAPDSPGQQDIWIWAKPGTGIVREFKVNRDGTVDWMQMTKERAQQYINYGAYDPFPG